MILIISLKQETNSGLLIHELVFRGALEINDTSEFILSQNKIYTSRIHFHPVQSQMRWTGQLREFEWLFEIILFQFGISLMALGKEK